MKSRISHAFLSSLMYVPRVTSAGLISSGIRRDRRCTLDDAFVDGVATEVRCFLAYSDTA